MKKNNLFLVVISLAFVFSSCQQETEKERIIFLVDFDEVTLSSDSIWNGSDLSGKKVQNSYISSIDISPASFENTYTTSDWGGSWKGIAVSAKTDSHTPGWTNEYSTIAGSGANNSRQYALAYDTASFIFPASVNGDYHIKSMMLANSTWAYWEKKNGGFGKKFVTDDWYKVIITGYLNEVETGEIEYYLADYRSGKSFLSNEWTKVDVSSIGKANQVTFTFDSSDKGLFGVNTPKYVCIDNIEFEQSVDVK